MTDAYAPDTIALHADAGFETLDGVAPAIAQSVNHVAVDADDFSRRATDPLHDRFYARHGNPTCSRIARVIAELEGAESAMMFASGMGALSTSILSHVRAGDHVVFQDAHYIGLTKLATRMLPSFGVETTRVDQRDPEAFAAALRPETRLIVVESPVNPTMTLTDLAAVAEIARAAGVPTLCDNTFATPINQRPIDLGIDLVVHSATKYIGGHHDLLAGCVAGRTEALERIWATGMVLGAVAAPFNAWLALRGVRTLGLRVRRQTENALALARWLEARPEVARVLHPGLESHPQHDLARRQMSGCGGLFTFVMHDGDAAAESLIRGLELFRNAGSLGGVDSLAIRPAAMFGGQLSEETVRAQGIEPGMVRVAVGVEGSADQIADFERAFAGLGG